MIDGDGQLVLRQAEFLGDQIPGELDRAVLEIVAEREVAEHLEKGVMPRGVADIVEVVVLAAGAHAFLRGGGALIGPLLDAGEDVLELHHAGIGEHQRRVVARHQRRRRHDFVAVVGKKIQKSRPDLVNAAHVRPIAKRPDLPQTVHLRRNAFRQGGQRCPESVQRDQGLAAPAQDPLIACCGCVDSLGAAVFFSYLFKTVTSGEIGLRGRRRRSNRPGNSQANGPRDLIASGKRRRRALTRTRPPTG